ncbi:hypothetical protein V7O62_03175 [Methanolobus sp. ZRKC2]|uniref:hypothetical protein n=1 Tax=Methanolobus sp. ZRKC2 TaxID=3125783 RepID=UPI00325281AD
MKAYSLALILLISLAPLSSADSLCPCDDLDYCVDWVEVKAVNLKWGELGEVSVDGIKYKLRPDDFNDDRSGVLISAQKGNEDVRSEFLFLNGDSTFHWEHDVRVMLTDIKKDSSETPIAYLKVFTRGLPVVDIDFKASSEEIDGVKVGSDQYAPGEEKHVEITVKNTGDGWIENAMLELDIGEFRLRSKEEFVFRDQILSKRLGCFLEDEEKTFNFTVIAPEWDGKTSPYSLTYNITAKVDGYDIKDDYYVFGGIASFECTEPKLEVKLEVVNEEINMSSWFVRPLYSQTDNWQSIDFEIWNAWEHSFLRTNIYNVGLYAIDDLEVQFSDIPEQLVVSEIYESGDYQRVSPEGQYYLGQKLIPLEQGKYTFDPVVVKTTFFGKDFTWSSGSANLNVHGPNIVFSKSLKHSGEDYVVELSVSNDGDRAAWVNVVDTVPPEANYVGGSFEESLQGEVPLAEWDWSSSRMNGTQNISVDGVLLPPGKSFNFRYSINPSVAPSLPYATCEFRGIPDYEGELQSSRFVSGIEVGRYFDLSSGEWKDDTEEPQITETIIASLDRENKCEEENVLHSTSEDDDELIIYESSIEVQEENSDDSFLSNLLGPLADFFTKAQQFVHNLFQSVLGGFSSAFGSMEGVAINAVENYLYAIVIIIALVVFGLVYTISK